jgi:hypothetical protein
MKNFISQSSMAKIPRKNKNEDGKRFRGKKKSELSNGSPERLETN